MQRKVFFVSFEESVLITLTVNVETPAPGSILSQ